MFRGSITALITPFANGAVDEKAFAAFVDWQIKEGTHGLVPVGTTGESPTVTHEEHRRIIEICVEVADRRVPVIAGAGSNSTDEAVSLTRFAEDIGADAVLSVVPYYNKPTQEGLFQHFSAVAKATSLPVVLYSVPGRTVVDITRRHHGAPARCARQHRRRQGRDGEHGESISLTARQARPRFHPALGRGHDGARLQRPWRPWLHLGDRRTSRRGSARSSRTPASRATTPTR